MNRLLPVAYGPQEIRTMDESAAIRLLLHRLNNQLGIILAHAELMEVKAVDASNRARAGQVVASVLDAMGTSKEIRLHLGNGR